MLSWLCYISWVFLLISPFVALFPISQKDEEDTVLMIVKFMVMFKYKKIFGEGFPHMLYV